LLKTDCNSEPYLITTKPVELIKQKNDLLCLKIVGCNSKKNKKEGVVFLHVFSFFVVIGYCYSRCICANSGATILRKGLCSLGLSATSQQYFSLRTNQPPATSQQYSSLRTNQHQPLATSQPNRLKDDAYLFYKDYAKLSGFSLRTARTSKETNHWVWSRKGWHDPKKERSQQKQKRGREDAAAQLM
jgi:hypothetical protein